MSIEDYSNVFLQATFGKDPCEFIGGDGLEDRLRSDPGALRWGPVSVVNTRHIYQGDRFEKAYMFVPSATYLRVYEAMVKYQHREIVKKLVLYW